MGFLFLVAGGTLGTLYEAIVQLARKEGLAGAMVIKGFEGFGAHSRMHTAKLLRLSDLQPLQPWT